MLLYEKRENGERHIYGSWEHTVPSEDDSRIEVVGVGEGSLDKHYYDDKHGGIIDEDGNKISVMLDGIEVFPRRLNPEPGPTPVTPVEPESKEDIDIEVMDEANYFSTNVYNKKGTSQSLNRENDTDIAENYYVKVASNVPEDAEVSIGDVNVNSTFAFSIGQNSFVRDVPYFIEEGDLYVAIPLIMFEGDVRVGNEVIYAGSPSEELTVTEARIHGNGGSTVDGFDAVMRSRTDYILYGIEGAEASDIFITKKDFVDTYDDGTTKHYISYGFSTGDPVGDGYGMGYYPFGWASTVEKWNAFNRYSDLDYALHIVGKGTAHVTSHFEREDV